ncbi:MAG: type 1 glutamine amidotransferase [Thermoleophilaceae bacterium]
MNVLVVVHHRNAAAGVFADPAAAAGHELVEWLPHESPPPALDGFDAALVFGGEAQVDQEDAHPWLRPEKRLVRELLRRGTPLLGVCLGSQLVAEAAGAAVRPAARPEIGWHEIELAPAGAADPVLAGLPERFEGFAYHHYEWLLPPDGVALARSATCLQAFRLAGRPVWGLQFHAEVTEADLVSWLGGWHEDPGAVATGLDPEAIRAESGRKIGAWNDVGRGISERFLALAGHKRRARPGAQ